MISAQDLCAVFNKVLKDQWGCVPGFDGQLLTKDMLDERISDEALKKLASKWIGKHVVDAGGLFAYGFRSMGMLDGYNPDGSYIRTIFNEFCETTGKLPKGGLLPGMVMFKKRGDIFSGVGLYMGNSIGIITSRLNSEWTYWGRLKNVEYDDPPSKNALRKREVKDMRVLRGKVEVTGVTRPINVRAGKSMSEKIIDVLPIGTQVTVVEDCGEFCKVQYMKVGYMKKEFLKEVYQK